MIFINSQNISSQLPTVYAPDKYEILYSTKLNLLLIKI